MELPVGLDYAWLACDAEGHVARFTNAGEGPIPVVVLANRELADRTELLTLSLPFVGEAEMRVSLPDLIDFRRSFKTLGGLLKWLPAFASLSAIVQAAGTDDAGR